MKPYAYLITCLTNLHAGAGGTNYDIIDNTVQRDPTDNLPAIFSSSLKGALREFFKNQWGKNDEKLNFIFGPDGNRNKSNEGNIGHYKFFSAQLLSMPVRAKETLYYNATTPENIKTITNLAENLGIKNFKINIDDNAEESKPKTKNGQDTLEDWEAKEGLELSNIYIGDKIALFHQKDFSRLASKLPVIARNKLDNGQSKNLFYEEVVPRETRFVFFVLQDDKYQTDFEEELTSKIVQIGANGSIGYGYCKISKII